MSENTTNEIQAAHGEHTTHGIPHGVTSLTPFIVVPNARDAIAFYRDVFGARVAGVTEMGSVVAHAVLDFGNGQLQLGEPAADYRLVPPPSWAGRLLLPEPVLQRRRRGGCPSRGGRRNRARATHHVRIRRPVRQHPRPVRRALVGHDPSRGPFRRRKQPPGRRLGPGTGQEFLTRRPMTGARLR